MFSCYSSFKCEWKSRLALVALFLHESEMLLILLESFLSVCSTNCVERPLKASPQRQQGSDPELIKKHLESVLAFPGNECMWICIGSMQLSLCLLPLAFISLPLTRKRVLPSGGAWRRLAGEGGSPSVCAALVWLQRGILRAGRWSELQQAQAGGVSLSICGLCLNSLTFEYPSI